MRTDVKVGLVCVLVLIIAVVSYFAMQGKNTPAAAGPRTTVAAGPAAPSGPASPSADTTGPASPPVAGATPSAGTTNDGPLGVDHSPVLGQTPSIYAPPGSTTTTPAGGSPLYAPGSTPRPILPPVGSDTTGPISGGPSLGGPATPSLGGLGASCAGSSSTPGLGGPSFGGPSSPSVGPSLGGPSLGGSTLEPTRTPSDPLQEPGPRFGSGYPGTSTLGGSTLGGGNTYTIQSGDNLTTIAKKHHTTVSALKAANPAINPDRLKIKQVINLPAPGSDVSRSSTSLGGSTPGRSSLGGSTPTTPSRPTAATPPPASPTRIAPGSTYKVQRGDTLRKISKAAYGNENLWQRILRSNRGELRSPTDLTAGMTIKIPAR